MDDVRHLQEEELNTIKSIFFAEFEDYREKRKASRPRKRLSETQGNDAGTPGGGQQQSDIEFSIHVAVEELSSGPGEKFPEMSVDVHFKFTPQYPLKEKPFIEIINPVNVSTELMAHVRVQLDRLASERIGESVIFDLVECTRELLRSDQDYRKSAAARRRDEEERTRREFDEEVKKRTDQVKLARSSLPRPSSLTVTNPQQTQQSQQNLQSAVTKLRVRSGSASIDTDAKPVSPPDTYSFLGAEAESRSVEVRTLGVVKDGFLGEKVSLFLAHSIPTHHSSDSAENTYFMVNGYFGVDPLTPLAQITKTVDSIEREVDVLKQSLPASVDKHLIRLLGFRYLPVSAVEPTFQVLFSFPGYGLFLSDLAKQSVQLSLQSIRSISFQMASGLQFLHQHNVLHKFLIPELVFISLTRGFEDASLMLYGVGKHIVDSIASPARNKILESRLKFVRRLKESKKTDILLLGCTVYYMATGGIYPSSLPVKPLTATVSPNEAFLEFVNVMILDKENDRPAVAALFSLPFLSNNADNKTNSMFLKQDTEEDDGEEESSDDEQASDSSEGQAIEAEEYRTDSRLHKDFRILAVLGKGGFGECFKAQNKLDGRLYAVKRVQLPTKDQMMNRMILREVKLLSRLNHENIVRYFNAWQETVRITRRKKHDTLSPSSPLVNSDPLDSSLATPKSKQRPTSKDAERSLSFGVDFVAPPPVNGGDTDSDSDWSYTEEDSEDDDSSSEELSLFPQRLSSVQFSGNKVPPMQLDGDTSSSDVVLFEHGSSDEDAAAGGDKMASDIPSTASSDTQMLLCLYIQMELCDTTLRQLINQGALFTDCPPFDGSLADCQKRAWILFKQLVDGLAYIHEQGMIHRDLTPNNIFLTSDDRIKIGDFGLALKRQQQQQNNNIRQNSLIAVSPEQLIGGDPMTPSTGAFPDDCVVGTSFYISPEILSGGRYDQKTDMFSLGIVLIEMFYHFETGSERVNVLSQVQRANTDDVEALLPSPLVKNGALWRAVKLIDLLTCRNPDKRPTAKDLLYSDLFPSPSELGDKQLSMLIQSIVSNSNSPEYKQLLSSLFTTSSKSLSSKADYLYDCFLYSQKQDEVAAWKRSVVEKMVREFLYRFSCRSYYWPQLMPVRADRRLYADSVSLETLLSADGVLLALPADLRISFARNVVRSNLTECRRFELGRVYRGVRVDRAYPTELTELAVDIVAPLTPEDTLTSSCIVLTEVVCICLDLWKQFIFSEPSSNQQRSQQLKALLPSTVKVVKTRKTITNLVINHLDILRAVLMTLPSNEATRSAQIDAFMSEINKKLSSSELLFSKQILLELVHEYFPECRIAVQDVSRVVSLLHQLLVEEPERNDVERLSSMVRNFKKAPNFQQASTLGKYAIAQLRSLMNAVRALYPNVHVLIQTNFMNASNIYSKFVFRLEQLVAPSTAASGGSQKQPQEVKRSTLAVGGDYSHILDLLRFTPTSTERPAPASSRIAVGFSFDFETLQRSTSIVVCHPFLSMPLSGEVSVALASPDHRDDSNAEEKQTALTDLLKFCWQLRKAGFVVTPMLYRQTTAILENSEAYLAAHLPITRVVVLLKHEKPPKKNKDLSPFVNITFELYFRIHSMKRMDSRTIDVSNSSGDFSAVILAVQEMCASTTRLFQSVGVLDTIMSNVVFAGAASLALGASTPSTETPPVPVPETTQQQQQPQTQQSQSSSLPVTQPVSNTLRGGLSAYTDITWLPEDRLTDKFKRSVETQMISLLSPKLKTFNPSAHVDIVLLEVDAPAIGTLASWLSAQVQQLHFLLAAQPSQYATNTITSWASSIFQVGGDLDKALSERHARYRRYLGDKISEIIDIIVNRISGHHHHQLSFLLPSGAGGNRQQSSSSYASSSSTPLPVMVLYAIKDNGYQFVM